ncbi:MAG: hypothetical protein JNK65_01480, partial [Deltaproteobacteria bacterium]|nr:hypothetical protein [Deltaproteobacteria bacterium]
AKCIKAGAEEFILKTRESLKTLPSTLMECIQKRKKKKISLLPDRNKKVINSVFHEIESISKTMKSVYQKIGEQSSYYGEKIGDLRKIAIIDHQMENLKDVLRKLFSRVSK